MSSILDAAVLIGEETTYGTAVSLTRGYEAKSDTWKRVTEPLESVGMRAGMETVRSDRRRQITIGAEGDLTDLDFMTNGMGLILQAMLGAVSGPTADVVTLTTNSDPGEPQSFTVQVLRVADDGTVFPFTYPGAVVTSWTISQAVNDFLKLGLTFDARTESTAEGAGTPSYPAGAIPYDWTEVAVSIGGSPVDNVRSLEFSGDLGLKTDRRYLNSTALKKAPRRASVPTYSGSIEADFSDLTEHGRYIAGSIFAVEAVWTSSLADHSVTITAPACQYDGDSPSASLSDLTTATMPFRILDNGTDPAITIAIESSDATL